MGLREGKQLFHHANVGNFTQLLMILKHRAELKGRNVPIVHFDASWLARKFGFSGSSATTYSRIGDLVYLFAKNGVSVRVVLDGPYRHHSKKARAQRVMDVDQARLDSLLLRQKLLRQIDTLRDASDLTDIDTIEKEIVKLEKLIRSREKKFQESAAIPADFAECIRHEVDNIRGDLDSGEVTVSVEEAVTQADCVICFHAVRDSVDGAVANDGDFIAVAGSNMMLIKDFSFKRGWKRKSKSSADALSNVIVAIGYKDEFQRDVVDKLSLKATTKYATTQGFQYASHPLFEFDNGDPSIRGAIMVGLGCDTLPNGCSGVGPPTLYTEIMRLKDEGTLSAESLYNYYASITKDGYTANHFRIFSESAIYEPGNISTDDNLPRYIHDWPTTLTAYNKEFVMGATDIAIDSTIQLCICCGPKKNNVSSHVIAVGEPTSTCIGCNQIVCSICKPSRQHISTDCDLGDGIYCLPCLMENVLCGNLEDSDMKLIDEKRKELREKHNVKDVDDLSAAAIHDIYDEIVRNNALVSHASEAKFPTECTSFMDNKDGASFKRRVDFDIRSGGSFLQSDHLTDNDLKGILLLMSSLTTFSHREDKSSLRNLPEPIITFIRGCRDGDKVGDRIPERTSRACMDPRSPSIIHALVAICVRDIDEKEEVMLLLKTKVRASMKDEVYETSVCFSQSTFVSCSCTCPCGSQRSEKIACVHTFVPMLQMSYFLIDGFIQHSLCEIAARWESAPSQMNTDKAVCNALTHLMCAVNAEKYCHLIKENKSLSNMLHDFRVGTDRPKAIPLPPPYNQVYLPLREQTFTNPSTEGADFVDSKMGCSNLKTKTTKKQEDELEDFKPSYSKIDEGADVIYHILSEERTGQHRARVLLDRNEHRKEIVGHRIVSIRRLFDNSPTSNAELNIQRERLREALNDTSIRACASKERAKRKRDSSLVDPSNDADFVIRRPNDMIVDNGDNDNDNMSDDNDGNDGDNSYAEDEDEDNNDNEEVVKADKDRNRKSSCHLCSFPKCTSTWSKGCRHWHRLPTKPLEPTDGSSRKTWLKYHGSKCQYEEMMRRVPLNKDSTSTVHSIHARICHLHIEEEKRECKQVQLPREEDGVMENCTISFVYTVPATTGVSNLSLGPESRGLAVDRGQLLALEALSKQSKGEGLTSKSKGFKSKKEEELQAQNAALMAQLAEEKLERIRMVEMQSPNSDLRSANRQKVVASGLDVHLGQSPHAKKLFRIVKVTESGKDEDTKKPYNAREKEARVTPFSLSPFEISARTGFADVGLLLSFTLLVCNGDVAMMTKRVSELTWYEEWFMYYEYIWGRSITNNATCMAAFSIKDQKIVRRVIMSKLRMVLHARKMWPKYANMTEDEMLRDDKWNNKYKGKRLVFWDTTGLKLNTPSNALLQRLTYSAYYAGNVAKGGIFVQLCGWMGTHELYPGAMSDSKYLNETGIFDEQAEFQKADGDTPFINEVDRGFRSCRAAWRKGQFILQPNFMKSDGKFTTGEVLRSASIAADRSGNERAVRVAKMSAYVKRGLTTHNDHERLADVWLAWSFQANFMFRSVV